MPSNKKQNKKKKNKAVATKKDPSGNVPLECTKDEFEDLLASARSLTVEEARMEIVDCARYGEVDAVRAILDIWSPEMPDLVDVKEETTGSTALHKSSANNHVSTTALLLSRGAKHLPNDNGNTPLHWAAAAGHFDVVQLLLKHERLNKEGLDVLLKNNFGRSALTEGFSSQKTEVTGLLLEHDSAEEDKLIDGGSGTCQQLNDKDKSNNNNNRNDNTHSSQNKKVVGKEGDDLTLDQHLKNSEVAMDNHTSNNSVSTNSMGVTHEFDLLRDGSVPIESDNESTNEKKEGRTTLLIRELPIAHADNPFGDKDVEDTTGLGIWCASIVMARWLASSEISSRFAGKSLLELGAGCAIPGLAAAMYSEAKTIYLTDLNPVTMNNLKYNMDLNSNHYHQQNPSGNKLPWIDRVKAVSIDWGDKSTWPEEKLNFVLGSDLIYQKSIVPLLKNVVDGLLKEDGSFLYVCPDEGARDGLREFIAAMSRDCFRCVTKQLAPPLFRSNPLSNGDDEEAFLHFHELPITDYRLYEFRRC